MVYREQNFSFPLNCKIAAYRGKEPQIVSTILPQPSQRLISRNPDTFQYTRPSIYIYIYIYSKTNCFIKIFFIFFLPSIEKLIVYFQWAILLILLYGKIQGETKIDSKFYFNF